MKPDIQRSILGACARFLAKRLEPINKSLEQFQEKLSLAVTKSELESVRKSLDERLSKPSEWFPTEIVKGLIPAPIPGEPGLDAEPIDIKDVVAEVLTTDALKLLVDLHVAEAVAKYFEENPVQHGKHGEKGDKGDAGLSIKGEDGKDGIGLAGAVINRDGELIITKTNGEQVMLGAVIGKDGKDGDDGLGFDDADIEYDGERSFTVKWQQGDRVKEKSFHVPTIIDRGYWREGADAQKGDAMTHDGTLWIALCDTKAKPSRESGDWRIGARKGRDGMKGDDGKPYVPPAPIKLNQP